MTVEIGKNLLDTRRYGRPLFRFELIDNRLRVSTLGCINVTTVEINSFRSSKNSFLLTLFLCELESYNATDEYGTTILTLYRFKKYKWMDQRLRGNGKE